jgi:hypothetical protein
MIGGDLISLLVYIAGFVSGNQMRMSGNHIYDFFMGSFLNPAIGSLDLKMYYISTVIYPPILIPSFTHGHSHSHSHTFIDMALTD